MRMKRLAIQIVIESFGDDLERARAAFRYCTREEMQAQYGESGKTRQQILDGYLADRRMREDVVAWLEEVVE